MVSGRMVVGRHHAELGMGGLIEQVEPFALAPPRSVAEASAREEGVGRMWQVEPRGPDRPCVGDRGFESPLGGVHGGEPWASA